MTVLREALKLCDERLGKYRRPGQRIGEQNTKAMLIEPVLQALGWNLFDPDEVNREYRRRSADNPVDYALLLLRTPHLFVEAKGLGENLDDPRWANQTISYAAVAGVEWVALTDGAQWRVYNAHAPVPVEDKLFRVVDVASDIDAAEDVLDLLSKENMRENRIHELWQGYFVDRQVHHVLTELFAGTEPPADLVNLVAKRIERLGRQDVRASLVRARATFDFPLPTLAPGAQALPMPRGSVLQPADPPTQQSTSPQSVAPPITRREPARAEPKVSPEERRIKIADLLRSGRIQPGHVTARYDGQTWNGHLTEDGAVIFQGQRYPSLSAAGAAAKMAARGPDIPESIKATDGWDFWSARDLVQDDLVTLKEIRRRAASPE